MSKPEFNISSQSIDNVQVLSPEGAIDADSIHELKTIMDPLSQQPGARILLDCRKVTFICSRGFGLLAQYHRRCFSRLGWFALCNVNRKVMMILEMLGLGKILNCYGTREEALANRP